MVSKPPILALNGNLFSLYLDDRGFSYDNQHGTDEDIQLSFNDDLKNLLDNRNHRFNDSNADLYSYVLNLQNVMTTYDNPVTSATYLVLSQSYGCLCGFSPIENIVFLSDVVEELDAAREAGLRTVLLDRRSDYPQPRAAAANGHPRVERFAAITP